MDTSWGRSPDTVNTGSIRHRRITVDRFGGPEALRVTDGETPPPAPGHTRIRVLAAGVGRTDLMARSGDYILQRRARSPRATNSSAKSSTTATARPTTPRLQARSWLRHFRRWAPIPSTRRYPPGC